jgi:hypothetical protein
VQELWIRDFAPNYAGNRGLGSAYTLGNVILRQMLIRAPGIKLGLNSLKLGLA